jgi:RNA polymerase sigma factor (sigma-70 family)
VVVEPYFELPVRLDMALHTMPDDARDAYILTELRGLTERDAAEMLGVSQPTIHRRAEAARNFIREEIA